MIESAAKLETTDEELTRLRWLVKVAYFEGGLDAIKNQKTYISMETLWLNSSAYDQLTFHKRGQDGREDHRPG